ncbi:MAG TPA: AAA family ATPase [Anaeromyxobacteraceae bacterium]|nr:AAA family ATPase [Anaeromyxobacteraceae bacterium]
MYLEHFGLSRKPFSKTPDPAFLFSSRSHAEALARLSWAIEEREVAVLTGEVGTGKTTLSRALVDAFADRCRFALIVNPALPPAQLLAAVAGAFGVREKRRKVDTHAALAEHLGRLDGEGLFPVVIVDEAQLVPGRAGFDELRLLTNLAADDRALLGLVLVGQPELRERLPRKGGEALAQRVGVAYHLGPLDAAETFDYLAHRLRVAGRAAPLFTSEAVRLLHARSGGVPRLLNQIANGALLEGFARDAREIGADVVKAAIEELDAWVGAGARDRVD